MTSNLNNKIQLDNLTLINDDCFNVLKSLQDNCVDLILTDPPYFKVKSNDWDNQWKTENDYLAWLDDIFFEFWRVLKPNGSLYCFCSSKLASETELLIKERFNALNHIVWAKPNGPWLRQNKESLRSYFPATERIIFAEHYNAEGKFKGQVGYAKKCNELKQTIFASLISYFKNARDLLGVTAAEINKATGTQMCSHWFSANQWHLPSESQYKALQELFRNVAREKNIDTQLPHDYSILSNEYDVLSADYQILIRQYDELKSQYESLRRPFRVSKEVPYTDIWTYKPVAYYQGKHPCEKPSDMLEDIIKASSREGDLVADFFAGSGSTLKASIKLNRHFLGCELDTDYYNQIIENIIKKI